jgi:hypothetical protein
VLSTLALIAKAIAAGLLAFFESGLADDVARLALQWLTHSDAGRAAMAQQLLALMQAFAGYWAVLKLLLVAVVAVLCGVLGWLLWKTAVARGRRVFISFQHEREPMAEQLEDVLLGHGFRVLRVRYEQGARHQKVLGHMQRSQRLARAVVCIPGDARSAVDHEVYAASVLQQPVLFLLKEEGGTLPDAADKRYPMLGLETVQAQGFETVAELLHYLTDDAQAARTVFRRAVQHPLAGQALGSVLRALVLVAAVALVVAVAYGAAVTAGLGGAAGLHRAQAVVAMGVLATAAALVVLPLVCWVGLAAHHVYQQHRAMRRATLNAGDAEFSRDDWLELVPGLAPGQPLYQAMLNQAPLAHHEKQARQRRWRPRRA